MRTKCRDAETNQDSILSRAYEDNRYSHIQFTQPEMRFMKREAHRANRRSARADVRALYPTRKVNLV